MAESFEDLDILRDLAKDKVQKVLSRHCTGMRSRKKKEIAVSVLENDSKKYSSSLRRQLSWTKPNAKLVKLLKLLQSKKSGITLS